MSSHARLTSATILSSLAFLTVIVLALSAGTSGYDVLAAPFRSQIVVEGASVEQDGYGGIYIAKTADEFSQLGAMYGDSIDIRFSNGYELYDIPYYSGYFNRKGEALLLGYPGHPYIKLCINNGGDLWGQAAISDGDTASITIRQSGKYLQQQEALNITYTANREDYASDVAFANFREIRVGALKEGTLYRSATPICNDLGRPAYVEPLMKENKIAYDLDLSDNPHEVDIYIGASNSAGVNTTYFSSLYKKGRVGTLDLPSAFPEGQDAATLAAGLAEMSKHDGPYLVHCIEGKDRTGFTCILLEALAGATYDEMLADYMMTYENYYGITAENSPVQYDIIVHTRFDDMLAFMAGIDAGTDLQNIDMGNAAHQYLISAGMSDREIEALSARLCD